MGKKSIELNSTKKPKPASKKSKIINPTKKLYVSNCLKQCATKRPKKVADCQQKCYDKNTAEKPKINKKTSPSNKDKLNPSKKPKPTNQKTKRSNATNGSH